MGAACTKVALGNKHKDTVAVSGYESLLPHGTQLPDSQGQLWAAQDCKLVTCLQFAWDCALCNFQSIKPYKALSPLLREAPGSPMLPSLPPKEKHVCGEQG